MKWCSKCKSSKPVTCYYADVTRQRLRSWCKPCHRADTGTRYRTQHPTKTRTLPNPRPVGHLVYALLDPRFDSKAFYVGSTIRQLNQRLNLHVSTAKLDKSRATTAKPYIQSLLVLGLRPTIVQLSQQPTEEATKACELRWITDLKALDHPLANRQNPVTLLRGAL
jgi:hypothetical protein